MILPRIFRAPEQTFFLLGPRGTGKSTWLRALFPQANWVNLLDGDVYQRLLTQPASLASEVRALPAGEWVVIDEVQRVPQLLNEVHRLIEESRRRFVLCGSSARKLRRAGVNLLAGRALLRAMHPFVPAELGDRFDLEDALRHGLLPVVWASTDRLETLRAYTQLYLKEEIQAEALVRNLPGFVRFLPIAALFHGQQINVTNIAREAGVARTTVHGYLEILEDTLLCFSLSAYEAKLRVRERKLPKLYWCDPGLVRAVKRSEGPLLPEERGVLFEGLVAQTLRAYRDYQGLFDEFFYWAPAAATETEVDFLLRRGSEFVAVEVKSGTTFTETWCKGLRAIDGLKGLRRRIVVMPVGPRRWTEDGIEVMSFGDFAGMLAAGDLGW
ncbi:MAG: DUF4143 domain-containing protein [Verrucomicrobiae bacterium]|nr:DUF4143 domain-containing protein [Verrucomicrobiae bacterium]